MPFKEINGRFVAAMTIALFAVGLVLAAAGGALGMLAGHSTTAIESDRPVETPAKPAAESETVKPAGSTGDDREIIRPGVRDEGTSGVSDERSYIMPLGGSDLCCVEGNIPPMDRVRDEA